MNKDNKAKKGEGFFKKEMFSSRKFKYGSSAAVFTAVFVVLVILVNALLSVIDSKTGGLYIDLTSEKIFSVTDASKEALKDVTLPVEIIFCREPDIIASSGYADPIKRLAESYEKTFSNITVSYHDIVRDPTYFNKFKRSSTDTIKDSSIIVYCPTTGISEVYTLDSMYKYSTSGSLFAFDGENKLTTGILRTARPQTLKAGFTKGHGETGANNLMYVLAEQGYEVSQIDLKTVTEEEFSAYNLVIICDPKNDFTGVAEEKEGNVNEIALLSSYLTGSFGNLMVFMGPETAELPELHGFLADEWGISYTSGTLLREDARNAVSPDGYAILGTYSNETGKAGYALHSSFSKNGTSARALFDYAMPLTKTFEQNGYRTVSAVATTSKSASVIRGTVEAKAPNTPVMLISDYHRSQNGVDKHAYVLVSGSSYFLNYLPTSIAYAGASQYGNNDLVKGALRLMGNTNIAANIDFKVLDESDISVTRADVDRLTRRLGIIIPVIIAVIGVAVFIKRKYL